MIASTMFDRPGATTEERKLAEELVSKAREIAPILSRNAAQADKVRRLVPEVDQALRDSGLLRLFQPRRFGGYQTDLRTLLEVSSELAHSGCGSSAWVMALLNGGALFAGQLRDQAQRDIWEANPLNSVAVSFNPQGTARRVEGGYTISGEWAWTSGAYQAHWAGIGFVIKRDENGVPMETLIGIAPMADFTIKDTWFVSGMRGTSSNTLVANEIFIPDHRTSDPQDQLCGNYDTEHKDEALYRAPIAPFAAISIVGPMLGLASAALDYVIEKAPQRQLTYTFYPNQSSAPTVQVAVARATLLIQSAYLGAYQVSSEIDRCSQEDRLMDYETRARLKATSAFAVVQAREAVQILLSAHGSSSFAEFNPLQRIARDIEIGSRHAFLNFDVSLEIYGKTLLGVEERIAVIV